jgi:16S rRNA (guanine527-N7)-methyltransferase
MHLSNRELEEISDWSARAGLVLDRASIDRLVAYRDLIVRWSERMNLVSRGDIPHLLGNHVLDSLTPVAEIPDSARLIDIGSGAGLPGIPLAIVRPDLDVTLLESIHKKAVFIRNAISTLGLRNVTLIESRLETMELKRDFDIATIRALPRRDNLIEKIQALVRSGGKIIYYEKRGVVKSMHV